MRISAKLVIVGIAAVMLGVAVILTVLTSSDDGPQQGKRSTQSGIVASAPSETSNRSAPVVLQAIAPVNPESGSFSIEPETAGQVQIVEEYIIFWPDEGSLLEDGATYSAKFE